MSELKAYGIRVIDGLVVESESGQLYLKSEADKVIAEKDEEISALKHVINMADAEYFKLKQSIDGCRQEIAGCHYCKDGEPLWKSNLESVVIGKNPQTRNPSIKLGHSLSIPIEYCPICGRKL